MEELTGLAISAMELHPWEILQTFKKFKARCEVKIVNSLVPKSLQPDGLQKFHYDHRKVQKWPSQVRLE